MATLPSGGQMVPEWANTIFSSGADTNSFLSSPVISNGILYTALKYRAVYPQQLSDSITLPATSTYKYCIVSFEISSKSVTNIIYLHSALILELNFSKCIDVIGNYIYVCGKYTSAVSVSLGNAVILPDTSVTDGFLIKYESNGTPVWAKQIKGISNDAAYGIAATAGAVYICGVYISTSSPVPLGNDANTQPIELPITSDSDGFLIKYESNGTPVWAKQIKGTAGTDAAYGIAATVDAVYVCGVYISASPISLGNDVILPTTGGTDGFLIKYESNGSPVWAKQIKGTTATGTDTAYGIAATVDAVYVCGYYISTSSSFPLGNDANNQLVELPITSGFDGFLIKYESSGRPVWAKQIKGTSGSDTAYGVAATAGAVYVCGNYASTSSYVSLGNNASTGTEVILPSTIGSDGFLIKYESNGTPVWAKQIKGSSNDIAYGVTATATDVYVCGVYSSTSPVLLESDVSMPAGSNCFLIGYPDLDIPHYLTISANSITSGSVRGIYSVADAVYVCGVYISASSISLGNGVILPTSTGLDGFLIKYDSTGTAAWAKQIQGSLPDIAYGVAATATDVYVCGSYNSIESITLEPGVILPITSDSDGFLIKYNSAGTAVWAKQIKGTGFDTAFSVAATATDVYICGFYNSPSSPVSLGDGVQLLQSTSNDGFLIKYNSSGLAVWANQIQGTDNDTAFSVAATADAVYVCGNYNSPSPSNPVSLGSGVILPHTIGNDGFLIKYGLNGTAEWAKQIKGSGGDTTYGVAATTDAVYICGSYSSTSSNVSLGNNAAGTEVILPSTDVTDGFLIKYDIYGRPAWAKQIKAVGTDIAYGVAATATAVYICGNYTANTYVSLGLDANGSNVILPMNIGTDGFLIKYESNGTPAWAKDITGTGTVIAYGITATATAVYIGGSYSSTGSVSIGNTLQLPAATSATCMAIKYSSFPPTIFVTPTEFSADIGVVSSYVIGSLPTYKLYYYPTSSPSSLEVISPVPDTLNGLTTNTSYTVYISTTLDGIELLSEPILFTTLMSITNSITNIMNSSSTDKKTAFKNLIKDYAQSNGGVFSAVAGAGANGQPTVAEFVSMMALSGITSANYQNVYTMSVNSNGNITIPIESMTSPSIMYMVEDGNYFFTEGGQPTSKIVVNSNTIPKYAVSTYNSATTAYVPTSISNGYYNMGTKLFNYLADGSVIGGITNNPSNVGNPVCFLADAPILTPAGYRPIHTLQVGDKVVTSTGRTVAVKRVFAKQYQPSASANPLVIPKGLFGATRALPISPNHEVMTASGKGMVKAKDLGLARMKMTDSFTYYNLELEDWVRDNLVVAGVVCESLAPAERITMTKAEFTQFVKSRYGPEAAARLRSVCFEGEAGSVNLPRLM